MKTRKPNRLREYDYSLAGWYYVTICTKNHKEYFGKIENEDMILNDIGKTTDECWRDIPKHYKETELDEYIIMPNHIHGIIIINEQKGLTNVGQRHASALQQHVLGNMIGSFKSAVSKDAHLHDLKLFKWQDSFYDRIIRNENELYNIRKYINQNPLKWDLEKGINNLDI